MTDDLNHLNSIFDENWPEDHRSGVVAIIGRPNAGKSTLINRILGQKIAIVTPKPQTTRKQQLGIYTTEQAQILFTDTPGIHDPHHKLGEYMNTTAQEALRDADVIVWILEANSPPHKEDKYIASLLESLDGTKPIIMALNKGDLLLGETDLSAHKALVKHDAAYVISAIDGTGVPDLLAHVTSLLPLGPRYYPVDQVSEVNLRFIASEVIREKIILNTEQEIPHSVAVEVDSFKEGEDRTTISAIIYVERDTQKGIVIGKRGQMIKTIGTAARQELMTMFDQSIHLDLRVKVLKNWRKDEKLMKRMGYRVFKDDED